MSTLRCVICGAPLGDGVLRVRYEDRIYVFEALKCKRIFQENPDRYLDATGEVLEEPR
jgi:ribosomal protein L24E